MATDPNAEPTLGGIFSKAILRSLLVVALVAIAVGIYAVTQRRAHPTADVRTEEAAWCRTQYASARSAADSGTVDAKRPPGGGGQPNSGRICRELRMARLTGR